MFFGKMASLITQMVTFKLGKFNLSSFNPYIYSYGFNIIDDDCYWENGEFVESEFYYSKWYNGKFISGTASGMAFLNGTSYYMNAYNILWQNGVWKNGNWNGSIFKYNGSITNVYQTKILDRLNFLNGNDDKLHIWNIFEDIPNYSINPLSLPADVINTLIITNTNITGINYQPTIIWI